MSKIHIMIFLVFLIVSIVGFILGLRWQEKEWHKKNERYPTPAYEDKLDIVITSAYFDNRWYFINDSLAFDAKHIPNDSTWLSDYLRQGDVLIKRKNNDTIYILRNYNLNKYVIVRE